MVTKEKSSGNIKDISFIDKSELDKRLVENLTFLNKDMPRDLTVDDFILLKKIIKEKKNILKGYVQHDFEIKMYREIYNELNVDKNWLNKNVNNALMYIINKEINLKFKCEQYIAEQYINLINKINIYINDNMEKGISIKNGESARKMTKFLVDNNLENESKLVKVKNKRDNNFIKKGRMAILPQDVIQKELNRVDKSLADIKIAKSKKNKFYEIKKNYERVVDLIDSTYKNKENKYDTIKLLNDSIKTELREVINDITNEVRIKENKNQVERVKTGKLLLNRDVLEKRKKELSKSRGM